MADHLFGGAFDAPDQVAPPISTDNTGDHLFGSSFNDAPPKAQKTLYRKWLDETISGNIVKSVGRAMTLPGDVMSGKVQLPSQGGLPGSAPANSGEVTLEPNSLGSMFMDPNTRWQAPAQGSPFGRAVDLAGVASTSSLPTVTRPGASSVNLLNPSTIDPATAQLAQIAREKYGMPIRGGQISENHMVKSADSLLNRFGIGGYAQNSGETQGAFSKALAGLVGQDADRLTPQVMSSARNDLKKTYQDISKNTTFKADDLLGNKLMQIVKDADVGLSSDAEKKALHGQIGNVLDHLQGTGEFPGKTYQALRKTGSPLDVMSNSSNSSLGYYAREIKNALDEGFRRSAGTETAAKLAETDKKYAIMKQLRPLVAQYPEGDIPASRLMSIARSGDAGKERMAFGNGGDMGELAQIGQRFIKPVPSSNTAENTLLMKVLGIGGAGLGGVGAYMHDPMLALQAAGTALGTGAVAKGTAAALKSDWYANKLITDALRGKAPKGGNKLLDSQAAPYLPALQATSGTSAGN